jgi:CBS domain-containing protein/anti-sigma regulatory factor (Ser/Thr protein kinase)
MTKQERFSKVQELVYELKVSDAMAHNVVVVKPDAMMSELRTILRKHKISGVPVAANKKMLGIISIEDFIKWLAEGSKDCPIKEKMTTDVIELYDDEPLVHAVSRFEKSGFGRFPVLDRKSKKLVGVITKGDIIERVLRKLEIDYHEEEIHRYRASHIFEDIVADKMALVINFKVEGKNFKKAGEVSSRLRKTLTRLNIHPQIIRRVSIATYEAEMNLVFYADDGGEISAKVQSDKIRIDIIDSGPGIPDVKKALEPGYSTAPDWVRELGFGAGMGLVNIKKCADDFNLVSKEGIGTHLRISMNMKTT